MQNLVLWAEDLEGHRQPSLYYLNDDEGADGPHLICDWNGAPTDVGEFDIDVLSLMKEHNNDDNEEDEEFFDAPGDLNQFQQQQQNKSDVPSSEEFVDYPNPAAEMTKTTKNKTAQANGMPLSTRQNDLIVEDCAHLDFLSVPPITSGLLRRIVRNLQRNKAQTEAKGASDSKISV